MAEVLSELEHQCTCPYIYNLICRMGAERQASRFCACVQSSQHGLCPSSSHPTRLRTCVLCLHPLPEALLRASELLLIHRISANGLVIRMLFLTFAPRLGQIPHYP